MKDGYTPKDPAIATDIAATDAEAALAELLLLMARLRDPERGCPWDVQQTFATIAPYTIEEAYEVADAIERNDPRQIRDELGDLLFQVVFHAQMARERGWFDFAQVARAIHDKLVRRHPHVFGDTNVSDEKEVLRNWEDIKARERAAAAEAALSAGAASTAGSPGSSGAVQRAAPGTLSDIPRALPSLIRAAKIGKRAGRVGFDWPNAAQVREKVLEELREVDGAIAAAASTDAPAVVEEMGDLLFAMANWSRHLGFDAEEALRAANAKFERRFRDMESVAAERGLVLERLTPDEWEALWAQAKSRERTPTPD